MSYPSTPRSEHIPGKKDRPAPAGAPPARLDQPAAAAAPAVPWTWKVVFLVWGACFVTLLLYELTGIVVRLLGW